mgnify:CR=1 FL=1
MGDFRQQLQGLSNSNSLEIATYERGIMANLLDIYEDDFISSCLVLDHPSLEKINKKASNIYSSFVNLEMSKYQSLRLNEITIDNTLYDYEYYIYTLGRYFPNSVESVKADNPRRLLRELIINNKKRENIEQFSEWDKNLVQPFFQTIENAIVNILKEKKSNIILCSVPNSNTKNRFSNFINNLFQKYKTSTEVSLIPDLFISKEDTGTTMHYSANKRREMLIDSLFLNKKYLQSINQENLDIIILDDVITTGSHLEYCTELVYRNRLGKSLSSDNIKTLKLYLNTYKSTESLHQKKLFKKKFENVYKKDMPDNIYELEKELEERDVENEFSKRLQIHCYTLASVQQPYLDLSNKVRGNYIPITYS